jgi:transposase
VKEVTLLKQENAKLSKENATLRERLSHYEHPQDSHNSNLPPTKNPIGVKKKVNLREKSGRKSGGQPGHSGGHSRKKEVFFKIMPEGMPNTTLVTDCYASYFSANVREHQICTAHILRELIYLSELYDKEPWSEQMAALIRDAIHLKKTGSGKIDPIPIVQQFQDLLDKKIDLTYKKIQTLQNRLIKYKDYLFVFLKNELVPPDNNASERAFRVFKIKLKVSGFFKSDAGAQRFSLLHSIANIARKNQSSPFHVFQLAASCQ